MSEVIKNKKTAIVLFNLGGPDSLNAVRPFLFNLFFDKYIINLPFIFRYVLAKFISFSRERFSKKIYEDAGGRSPILFETQKQADSLRKSLKKELSNFRVFVCMRYWRPQSDEVVKKLKQYSPEDVILLPLYPQFSATTTASSVDDFTQRINRKDYNIKTICCYYDDSCFIKAHVQLIKESIAQLKERDNYRILFSAHSLPSKMIEAGDPYQWQVERSVKAVIDILGHKNLDYKTTYQSKIGPLKWLEPDTKKEIELAIKEKKDIMIVPIAFVSEHVETIVELDIEYKTIAHKGGMKYIRVPTLSINDFFIESLKNTIVRASKQTGSFISSSRMIRNCDVSYKKCPCAVGNKKRAK